MDAHTLVQALLLMLYGSKHMVWIVSFPLELHLVHKSEDGRIAVVAWLFVPGSRNNTFLAQVLLPHLKISIPFIS